MQEINNLINYALNKKILNKRDIIYGLNQITQFLKIDEDFDFEMYDVYENIDDLLESIVNKHTNICSSYEKELYKSKIIALLMDKPSQIENNFYKLYNENPSLATDYFYNLSKDVNYIKENRIKKNIIYNYESTYGELNITINLSKPEKTPEEIMAVKEMKSNKWPKCFLCKEHEGMYGSNQNPDRSNHRLIEINLNENIWYFQYSPYSYYNEHSIVLCKEHKDMKINRETFENLIYFLEQFPHYMIGSNADLPIVGGSMLTHDHYQAGKYEFPIFNSSVLFLKKHKSFSIEILKWPLSTIRLSSKNKDEIIKQSVIILEKWKNYSNEKLNIINKTDKEHNTVTPILRKKNDIYEMYLILRNNRTNQQYPDGIFHIHKDKHHIKKENVGLIEAIGLAVLPARLLEEMQELATLIVNKESMTKKLEKHEKFYNILIEENIDYEQIITRLKYLIGKTFVKGLEDCSVFKNDIEQFRQFLEM